MEKVDGKDKALVAFIGLGGAEETQYAPFEEENDEYVIRQSDKSTYETNKFGYPFLAKLIEERFEHIILIGTKHSKWGMLQDKIANQDSGFMDKKQLTEEDIEQYYNEHLAGDKIEEYKKILNENIHENIIKKWSTDYTTDIEIILIKEGRTKKENQQNIKKIQNVLSKINIKEITLDVTNGLRSHPMYVMSIISNMSAAYNKNIPLNIYYGMYDARLKEKADNPGKYISDISDRNGVAPMVDLEEIHIMDKWTGAVREFYSNGSVIQILNLLEKNEDYFLVNSDNQNYMDNYIDAFNAFSFAVNSNNLNMFNKAITDMHNLITEDYKLRGISDKMPIYMCDSLKQVIRYINKQFDWNTENEITRYSSNMFSLAQWYLKQNRFGDSVRTFQEAVITYVMEIYPDKIFRLLESRVVQWKQEEGKTREECVRERLFDSDIRQKIRNEIFDNETIIADREREYEEWKSWIKEYDYMKQYVHNPDGLLYKDFDFQNEKVNNIKEAEEIIKKFANKIKDEVNECDENGVLVIHKKYLDRRIDYLLDIKKYDVFISYRRSYHKHQNKNLNDGVLLATSVHDYLTSKGLRVFIDKREMSGKDGVFTQHLHNNLINSSVFLVILGNEAYNRDYNDDDQFYKEIITAVNEKKKIAVVYMEGFIDVGGSISYGKGVREKTELMKVAKELQRIGSEYSDIWEYNNIISLRKCIYNEVKKMLDDKRGECNVKERKMLYCNVRREGYTGLYIQD